MGKWCWLIVGLQNVQKDILQICWESRYLVCMQNVHQINQIYVFKTFSNLDMFLLGVGVSMVNWWWCDWSFAHCTAAVVTSAYIILRSNKIQNGDILVPNCLGCQSTSVCAELQMITLLVCQSPAGSVVVIVSDPCLELALDACCVWSLWPWGLGPWSLVWDLPLVCRLAFGYLVYFVFFFLETKCF